VTPAVYQILSSVIKILVNFVATLACNYFVFQF